MQRYINKISCLYGPALLLLVVFSACSSRKKAPDVSHIPVTVSIARFDEDLVKTDTNQVAPALQQLYNRYPLFLPAYVKHIMEFGAFTDSSRHIPQQMRLLLTNKDFRYLQQAVQTKFPDLHWLEQDLAQGFRYMKYYFPQFKVPQVVTFISAIGNYGAITVDTLLGVGLDMYMGNDFPVYANLPDYPVYMVRRFSKEYITTNSMQAIAQNMFPQAGANAKVVEQLVAAGKQQYFLDQVLPETPDTIRIGYTKKQLEWCDDNEQMIWQYFIQNELLYKTDWQEAMHFMGDGPSTQGMPEGSPGRIGYFVGRQIVRKYMERHPEVTLQQLMENKDLLGIFSESKYRPK
jgi:gliding motility-associated lipoprotein GldB